ncbi:MAG: CDP-alcohol phosphatidyltransferase family protein [Candidatus Kerfeldbacteria bacterium]
MNRFARAKEDLKSRFTIWWTAHIDEPCKAFVDCCKQKKEDALDRIFLHTRFGRYLYDRMSADDWTWLRLWLCWIPAAFIVAHLNVIACLSYALIWTTDAIDGWFARKKGTASDRGMCFETTVDSIFALVTFIAVYAMYRDMRWLVGVAGSLELIRLGGALYFRWKRYKPGTNRSGQNKTIAYVLGVGLRLFGLSMVGNLFLVIGIALSMYSCWMHLREYQSWKRQQR